MDSIGYMFTKYSSKFARNVYFMKVIVKKYKFKVSYTVKNNYITVLYEYITQDINISG